MAKRRRPSRTATFTVRKSHKGLRSRSVRADGDYKAGKRNGEGKYSYAKKGGVYEGSWQNGKRNGTGTMTYPDKSKYTGASTTRWRLLLLWLVSCIVWVCALACV